jgi:hypothetical protein
MSTSPDDCSHSEVAACKPGIGALILLLACVQSAGAAGPETPAAAIKLAARSIEAEPAAFALGRPVIVTRADVESPLGRARGLEVDVAAVNSASRPADPAFKAVLLTPRESTGRPAQPILPDLTASEPEARPVAPAASTPSTMTLASHPGPTGAQPLAPSAGERVLPKPSAGRPKRKDAAPHPAPVRTATRTEPPARKAALPAAAPRVGAGEIAATRAFTRF